MDFIYSVLNMLGPCPPASPVAMHQVEGIPTFVLVDGESGEIITVDGRSKVGGDAACNDFPWRGSAASGGNNAGEDEASSDDGGDDDDDDDDEDEE
jgi:hypothetical protein